MLRKFEVYKSLWILNTRVDLDFCHTLLTVAKIYFSTVFLNVHLFVSPQQKYFDSGDYNMAKAKIKNKQLPTAAAPEKTEITGDHIPTPQDLPQRKPSLVASKLAG